MWFMKMYQTKKNWIPFWNTFTSDSDWATSDYELRTTMIINVQQQQQQQQHEDMYGNEVKRRRMNEEGDHMKVWNVIS